MKRIVKHGMIIGIIDPDDGRITVKVEFVEGDEWEFPKDSNYIKGSLVCNKENVTVRLPEDLMENIFGGD